MVQNAGEKISGKSGYTSGLFHNLSFARVFIIYTQTAVMTEEC